MWGKFKTFFEQFEYSCYGSSEANQVSEVTPDDGKFVKKTSMPNPLKSIGYHISSATAPVAPDLLKALAIRSDTTVRRSEVDQEDLKP